MIAAGLESLVSTASAIAIPSTAAVSITTTSTILVTVAISSSIVPVSAISISTPEVHAAVIALIAIVRPVVPLDATVRVWTTAVVPTAIIAITAIPGGIRVMVARGRRVGPRGRRKAGLGSHKLILAVRKGARRALVARPAKEEIAQLELGHGSAARGRRGSKRSRGSAVAESGRVAEGPGEATTAANPTGHRGITLERTGQPVKGAGTATVVVVITGLEPLLLRGVTVAELPLHLEVLLPEGRVDGLGEHDFDDIVADLGAIEALDGLDGGLALHVVDKPEVAVLLHLLHGAVLAKVAGHELLGGFQRHVPGKDDLYFGHDLVARVVVRGGPVAGANVAAQRQTTGTDLLEGSVGQLVALKVNEGKASVAGHIDRVKVEDDADHSLEVLLELGLDLLLGELARDGLDKEALLEGHGGRSRQVK